MQPPNDLRRAAADAARGCAPAKSGLYIADILGSAATGWIAFIAAVAAEPPWLQAALMGVASLALYRALAFIHELFHQSALRVTRALWHLVAGVPLLIPLMLYLPIHQAHHNAATYGTPGDGEYEQFAGRLRAMVIKLMALNLLLPLALWVRFAVLTPLGAVVPFVRREVSPQFVHMALRVPFRAPELGRRHVREAAVVEAACCAWAWGLAAMAAAGWWKVVGMWAGMLICIAMLNTVRALCATHLYVESNSGRDLTGQFADSLNVTGGGLLTELLCPAGLRYHALHHLMPSTPYHELGKAHRLMEASAAGGVYRQAGVNTAWAGWQRLAMACRPGTASAAEQPTSIH